MSELDRDISPMRVYLPKGSVFPAMITGLNFSSALGSELDVVTPSNACAGPP
ncbi:hypothetical protein [Paraburkholderia sp. PGU19]|uniref:hypothetical protein n=1 Tax=Paraburkholderia sp. PGU19 TaxID=2735434 RepID=UPI0015DAF79C|nr:hypothetical protein [Paraburkholderia sp. PGU19]